MDFLVKQAYNTNICSYLGAVALLTDQERKLLNILRNYTDMHHHLPSMQLLRRKTGYKEGTVIRGFHGLADKGYIRWCIGQPVDSAVILNAWEGNLPMPAKYRKEEQGKQWWELLT
jgi:hypothetical protein